jgi:hypothetical protein
MMDGKRLSTRLSLTNVHIYRVDSPVQSSHASKRLKMDVPHVKDKGKAIASPLFSIK